MELSEIKERVDSAKEQYPYPDFHGEPLIALYGLYCQKIVVEANQAQAITDQQAEIERLRTELEGRIKAGNLQQLIIEKWEQGYVELKEKHEAQQAEIERLQAENAELVKLGCNTETLLHKALQQQPEAPQEPLKVRILRYLTSCRSPKTYRQISNDNRDFPAFLSDLMGMLKSEWVERNRKGWYITAAGRDYLASLEIDPHDLMYGDEEDCNSLFLGDN